MLQKESFIQSLFSLSHSLEEPRISNHGKIYQITLFFEV